MAFMKKGACAALVLVLAMLASGCTHRSVTAPTFAYDAKKVAPSSDMVVHLKDGGKLSGTYQAFDPGRFRLAGGAKDAAGNEVREVSPLRGVRILKADGQQTDAIDFRDILDGHPLPPEGSAVKIRRSEEEYLGSIEGLDPPAITLGQVDAEGAVRSRTIPLAAVDAVEYHTTLGESLKPVALKAGIVLAIPVVAAMAAVWTPVYVVFVLPYYVLAGIQRI